MTLIIKKLVIKGTVTGDRANASGLEKEEIMLYMEEMKKEIERECLDKLLSTIETKTSR